MVADIGDDLNSRKNRFDKADLIEFAFSEATGGILEWVDEEGWDLGCKKTARKFEVKSQKYCLFTPRGNKKKNTSEIKLTNTLQQAEKKKLNNTADYLILIDSAAMSAGIISYSKVVEKFSIEKKDGFSCKIPLEEIEILHFPEEFNKQNRKQKTYAAAKRELQQRYVKNFFN